MREHSNNHSDLIPNAENWILVSDPFERPKVYRHRFPVIKTEDTSERVSGVYIFVMDYPGEHPILLHDINQILADSFATGSHLTPTLRLILHGKPFEIGNAHPYIIDRVEGFLQLPSGFGLNARVIDLHPLRDLGKDVPFRLKLENNHSSVSQEDDIPTYRGMLEDDGTLALRQAVVLYDFFRGTP
jgi:hypothetical protein